MLNEQGTLMLTNRELIYFISNFLAIFALWSFELEDFASQCYKEEADGTPTPGKAMEMD